jgi:hypothetical protein
MNKGLGRLDSELDKLVTEYHQARQNKDNDRANKIHGRIKRLRIQRDSLAKRLIKNGKK